MADNFVQRFIKNYVVPELKQEVEVDTKNLPGDVTGFSSAVGIPPTFNEKQLLEHYRSWVYANVNAIADPVANIHFQMFRLTASGDVEEITRHEVLELLDKVNEYTTKHFLIYSLVQSLLLKGEGVWYLSSGKDTSIDDTPTEPTEIIPLDPSRIKIFPDPATGQVRKYEYTLKNNEKLEFAPWEIIFFKKPNPKDQWRGLGVVEAAFTTIQSDDFAEEWNRNFYYNSARPDGLLVTEQKLTKETRDRVRAEWESQYRGIRHAQKTAILEAGLDYKLIQQSAKDMDFLEAQRWNRDKLISMFGNTKIALGIVDDVNRANAEASELIHMKRTIRPMMQMITDMLNEFLVPLFDENVFLAFVDPVPEDKEQKIREWEIGWNKWLSTNDIRQEQGLEPVEGGDIIYIPFNLTPLGTSIGDFEPKALIKEMKVDRAKSNQRRLRNKYAHYIQKLRNKNIDKTEYNHMVKQVSTGIVEMLNPGEKKVKVKPNIQRFPSDKRFFDLNPEEKVRFMEFSWKGLVREAEPYEKRFESALKSKVYNSLQAEVLGNLSKSEKANKDVEKFLFDEEESIKLMIEVLTPILLSTVVFGGERALELIKIDQEYIQTSSFIQSFLRSNTKKFSKAHTQELTRQVRGQISIGLKNGEAIDEIAKRIKTLFSTIKSGQAFRLARTEVFKAINASTIDAWTQSGVVEGKQWFTAADERVCEWCAPEDGKTFGLYQTVYDKGTQLRGRDDNLLPLDYDDVDYPPLHPNCRCTLAPIVVGGLQRGTDPAKIKDIIKDVIKEYADAEPEEDSSEN